MKLNIPKIILTIIFFGLLAIPIIVGRFYYQDNKPKVDNETSLKKYGFYFEEVAEKSGVKFVHTAPKLDAKLDHIMPQIASMGAGVSVVDYNKDGFSDLYFTNSGEDSQNALYRNNKDGSFTDVAKELGIADVNKLETGVSMGAVWGDFDNDGFEDLFLYKWGKCVLFRNEEGKKFTEVSDAGFPAWANVNAAIWVDFDRDGLLDLFLGSYFREDLNLWKLDTTLIMPESFEYAKNGGRKYLFKN